MRPFQFPNGPITRDAWKAMRLQLDPDDDEAEQRIRMVLEQRTTRTLRSRLADMLDTLYPEGFGEFVSPDIEAARIHRRFLEEQALYDELSRALRASVDLGVNVAIDQFDAIGFGFDWTLANQQARAWADQYTGQLITNLAETTQRGVRTDVARWIDNGEPLEALVQDLSRYFSRERAELIASTEVTRAYAEGNAIAYRESGVVDQVEWRTARDEAVCPICGPLHGQRDVIGGDFGGDGPPPAHPRCRCWIVPVVDA